jgi:2'-hydroxyisoflavone reductase
LVISAVRQARKRLCAAPDCARLTAMRVLVLGGTVFLSRMVAQRAVARGHEVVCAARGASGAVPDGATLVRVDRDEGLGPLQGAEFDAVVDVATMNPAWVRAAVKALGGGARHWTFVSSMSVYADNSKPGLSASTAPLLPEVTEKPAEVTAEAYGGAKVASERAVSELFDGPAFLVRPGLIVGTGDPSDRYGYWPWRLHRGGEVLVPAELDAPVQLVDVLDLADWILDAGESRLAGTFDAVCHPVPLSEMLSRTAAGVRAPAHSLVPAASSWLEEHGVKPWAGPRSLPLWAPGEDYAGFMAQDVSASYDAGLRTRPIEESAADALQHELTLDPGRKRRAGLTPEEEAELLAELGR